MTGPVSLSGLLIQPWISINALLLSWVWMADREELAAAPVGLMVIVGARVIGGAVPMPPIIMIADGWPLTVVETVCTGSGLLVIVEMFEFEDVNDKELNIVEINEMEDELKAELKIDELEARIV
jgi:hypothetical protein